jgi:hypothetical protein
MIVPTMEGWIEQWNGYVPGFENVKEYDPPLCSSFDANWTGELLSELTVWGALPWFTHETVEPAFTVSVDGEKTKSLIAITFDTPDGSGGVD